MNQTVVGELVVFLAGLRLEDRSAVRLLPLRVGRLDEADSVVENADQVREVLGTAVWFGATTCVVGVASASYNTLSSTPSRRSRSTVSLRSRSSSGRTAEIPKCLPRHDSRSQGKNRCRSSQPRPGNSTARVRTDYRPGLPHACTPGTRPENGSIRTFGAVLRSHLLEPAHKSNLRRVLKIAQYW